MRKLNSIIFVSLIIALSSAGCKKWLDIQPESKLDGEDMFKKGDGFRVALNGIYQQVSTEDNYSRTMSWGFATALGNEYDFNTISGDIYSTQWYDYQPSSMQTLTSKLWLNSYNAIANCNKIIHEIATKDTMIFALKTVERDLILGEAKAMRAFLHFDLLRLFAPAPNKNRTANSIPYQLNYPSYVTSPMPVSKVMEYVIKDLEEAQQLVVKHDTITNRITMNGRLQSLLGGGSGANGGIFFNYRMHRMNYVAIQGLLARAYLYNGDRENALKKAEFLYKTYGPAGRLKWWAFTSESNTKGEDKYTKLVDDVIFAFYDTEIMNILKKYKGQWYEHAMSSDEVGKYFPTTERDFRRELINNKFVSEKWVESKSEQQWRKEQNFIIPMLRFSEIYYILSECYFEAGRTNEALTVLNQIRNGRGRTSTFSSTVRADFYNELFDEFHREFLMEGQIIFQHKRLDRNLVIGSRVIPMDNRVIVPVPQSETNF